ncbi:MAG: hypothetical protein ACQEUZ_05025 [Pseudomonadota bacterium]
MPALLIVRAEVPAVDREAFDNWYETEHLPEAYAAFACNAARRGWVEGEPPHHLAFYEFDSAGAAETAVASDAMKTLIADFDRAFPHIRRSREIVDIAQTL